MSNFLFKLYQTDHEKFFSSETLDPNFLKVSISGLPIVNTSGKIDFGSAPLITTGTVNGRNMVTDGSYIDGLPTTLSGLSTSISNEVARATNAESNLQTAISAIVLDASKVTYTPASSSNWGTAPAKVDAALDSVIAKVVANLTAINNEVTRATNAEAALQTSINALSTNLSWRPGVKAATASTTLASAANNATLASVLPFSDDDAPVMQVSDFADGDYILYKAGTNSKLFKVANVSGTLQITTTGVPALATGQVFLAYNDLPSPAGQEGLAIYSYNGSDAIKIADMDWSLATGITLSPSFVAGAGTVSVGDTVEAAISKLVANLAAEVTRATGVESGFNTRITAVENRTAATEAYAPATSSNWSSLGGAPSLVLTHLDNSGVNLGSAGANFVSSAQFDSGVYKFGGYSMRATTALTGFSTATFALTTAPWSVDLQLQPNVASSQTNILVKGTPTGGDYFTSYIPASNNNTVIFEDFASSTSVFRYSFTTTANLRDGSFHHYAYQRNGATLALYIDGVAATPTLVSGTFSASTVMNGESSGFNFNLVSGSPMNAYLDEVRITNAVTYTSNFTPPTAAYAAPASVPAFVAPALDSVVAATVNETSRATLAESLLANRVSTLESANPNSGRIKNYTNSTGSAIPAFTPVIISGSNITVATAATATYQTLIGVTAASIANGASGGVWVISGAEMIITSASFTVGKQVYVGASGGTLTQDPTTINSTGSNMYAIGRAVTATSVDFRPAFETGF